MSFPIHQISVSRYGSELQISQPMVVLPPHAAIQWIVTGVQNDETVELMARAANLAELGPFTFSRRGQGMVSARGSSGEVGEFEYWLAIYKVGVDRASTVEVARSAVGKLLVNDRRPRSGQTILVEYDNLGPEPRLIVDQLDTRIIAGDPVIFEFYLPKDVFDQSWVPSLIFPGTSDLPNRGCGPFAALSVVDGPRARNEGDGLIRRYLVATGSSGLIGSFGYLAVVRSADGGQVLSSPDPVIDNDGEVICPGC